MTRTRSLTIEKTVSVDVDVDVDVTGEDILESLRYSEIRSDFAEELGYIDPKDIGLGESIIDDMKKDLLKEILPKVTLQQLENFSRSL